MSANLDRGQPIEGAAPSKRGAGEESEETEVAAALKGAPEASEDENIAHSNQPLVSQAEPNFLKMMEQMTQFMGKLTQAVSFRDNSKAPALKTPSMKAPDYFDGTQAHKLRELSQSCKLIFHDDPANFFSDRKKVPSSTSFLTGRSEKCIEPYLSNISNEDPSYLLNNWKLFETQSFTLFGDSDEFSKAEQELDSLRMKESGHVSLYIADFRSLMSIIGGWRKQHIVMFTEEDWHEDYWINTRYHERQKENGGNQEKKPPVIRSNTSRPPQGSSSKRPHHKKNKKGKQSQASKDKPHGALLNKEKKIGWF
ncbi:hypothetical protein O181_041724 [Austropuccinia psidii MF-1]|uniref:Retrotransposon gag domain-containing protein n=1 Tax=Austropuccinia psidii MF-1 TaxID=1389203 RepID=A0A9Q3DEQ3_9BASI|nr:hypothetical protein [Austropuccinia psidii MF-1]